MKIRILLLAVIFSLVAVLANFSQVATRLRRPCASSTTPAIVEIQRDGDIDFVPCSGRSVLINGGAITTAIGSTITSATAGSIFFAGTSGVLAQDNNALFWDNTAKQLVLGGTTNSSMRFGATFGAVGKTISSPNDGNNNLVIGVPSSLKFTDANGNNPWSILPTSDFALNRTITAGGTTGNVTLNVPAGTANFAAGTSSLVVTNSLVTANSLVYAVIRTNDATALIKNVVPAAGSFTIRLNANATAETSVGFWVTN